MDLFALAAPTTGSENAVAGDDHTSPDGDTGEKNASERTVPEKDNGPGKMGADDPAKTSGAQAPAANATTDPFGSGGSGDGRESPTSRLGSSSRRDVEPQSRGVSAFRADQSEDDRRKGFAPVERRQTTSRTTVKRPGRVDAVSGEPVTAQPPSAEQSTMPFASPDLPVTAKTGLGAPVPARPRQGAAGAKGGRGPRETPDPFPKPRPSAGPDLFGRPFASDGTRERPEKARLPDRSALAPRSEQSHPVPFGPASRPGTYVVQENDTFWTISKRVYGTARYFQALALFNKHRVPDPQRMRPGTEIETPDVDVLKARFPQLLAEGKASAGDRSLAGPQGRSEAPPGFFLSPSGEPLYRVGQSDTLTQIARKHLGRSSRWIQIYQLNRDRLQDPNDLKIGTILRLPADAGRLRVVRSPRTAR
ncbi:MAG TPA: LysM peptidoglycan-binding domain-containing protein [Planctomycetaceae bacterium]|nr:LysM peptidoglycan-binding domain-containing protein [Planctomycetaceae bacterium]